jgi:hypothetical protein
VLARLASTTFVETPACIHDLQKDSLDDASGWMCGEVDLLITSQVFDQSSRSWDMAW